VGGEEVGEGFEEGAGVEEGAGSFGARDAAKSQERFPFGVAQGKKSPTTRNKEKMPP